MKIVLLSKCSLDIEQYVKFKMSDLISPSKSLISLRWVTFVHSVSIRSLHGSAICGESLDLAAL